MSGDQEVVRALRSLADAGYFKSQHIDSSHFYRCMPSDPGLDKDAMLKKFLDAGYVEFGYRSTHPVAWHDCWYVVLTQKGLNIVLNRDDV